MNEHFQQVNVATQLAESIGKQMRVKKFRSKLYNYCDESQAYVLLDKQALENRVAHYMKSSIKSIPRMVNEVMGTLNYLAPVVKNAEEKLNFNDMILDMNTFEKMKCNPKIFTTNYYPVQVTGKHQATPNFDAFLTTITCGDKGMERLILQSLAYFLDPTAPNTHIFICYGSGSNGKSVYQKIIRMLMNPQDITSMSLTGLESPHSLAALVDKKCCMSGELGTDFIRTEICESLKVITGGDLVSVNPKNRPIYSTTIEAKLLFSCNNIPVFEDSSNGMKRRIIALPFKAVISEADKDIHLFAKLESEKQGIFQKLIPELIKLKKSNYVFEIPEQSHQLKSQMFRFKLVDIFNELFDVTSNTTECLRQSYVTKQLQTKACEYGINIKKQDIAEFYNNTTGITIFKSGGNMMLSGIKPKYNLSPERHVDPETGEYVENV